MTPAELKEIKDTVKKTFDKAAGIADYYGYDEQARAMASQAVATLAQTLIALDEKEQESRQPKPTIPAPSTIKRLTT